MEESTSANEETRSIGERSAKKTITQKKVFT